MAIIPCKECGQGIDAEICWCKPCNSKRFEDDFPNWTSNSSEIDKFIQETQKNSERPETIFEWFDYSKFTILKQIEFSKNNKAYWEDGHILSWNEKSNKWNRHGGQWVKLVTHYCEKYLTSNFLKSEYEFSKVNPSNRLVYGMTRDPATKDYAVVEKLIDICPFCGQEWMCLRWCRGCHANRFKSEFQNWTSGNEDIDSFIHDTQLTAEFPEQVLEWIPESQFMKFDEIGRGGFGTVFKAYWKKGRIQKWCTISGEWKRDDPMWVAMKSVENDDECGLLEEVKNLHQCLKVNLYSLDCYGITRHPITRKYLIVMRYAEEGDLRAFLSSNFKTYTWKNRLDRLWGLATDIRSIHEKDLVHRDLHSGNVLFGAGRRSFVADLGLTCQDGQVMKTQPKGVLPYVAPEVFTKQIYTKATDIYSFAFIMWESTSCRPPFHDRAYDFDLAQELCNGLRPPVIEGTPKCYADLMLQCWDPNPNKRPTAQSLVEIFEKWLEIISGNYIPTKETNEIKRQFEQAELERQRNPYPVIPLSKLTTHTMAILTSRLLPTVSHQYSFIIGDDLC